MKRLLALILAMAMTFSVVMPSVAAAAELSDVSSAVSEDGSLSVLEAEDASLKEEKSEEESAAEEKSEEKSAAEEKSEEKSAAEEKSEEKSAQEEKSEEESAAEEKSGEQSAQEETDSEEKTGEEETAELAEELDTRPELLKRVKGTLEGVDGTKYTVTVIYGESAEIPEGAKVSVVELNQELTDEEKKLKENEKRPFATEKFISEKNLERESFDLHRGLKVKGSDCVLFTKFLDVALEKDGKTIQPKAPVNVVVETDAVEAGASDALEIAFYDAEATREWKEKREKLVREQEEKIKAGKLKKEDAKRFEEKVYTALELENETEKKQGARVTFMAEKFARLGISAVAKELKSWKVKENTVSVYGPRALKAKVNTESMKAPEAGLEKVRAFSVATDEKQILDYDVTYWVGTDAQTKEPEGLVTQEESALDSGVVISQLKNSAAKKELIGTEGAEAPVAIQEGDKIGVSYDTGLREKSVRADKVKLEGMLPKNADVSANDMLWRYSRPEDVKEDVQKGEAKTLAAYDITIESNSREFQPQEGESVGVSISGVKVSDKEKVEIWHVRDDGSVEVIRDFELKGDTVSFDAQGFSVYMVVEYTVDFHWGEYTYNLEGGSTIFLSELLETLINGASESGNKASEASEGADGSVEAGTSAGETENRSQANGSAGVYDTTQLQKVLEHPELVEKVEFSDPELMEVLKSYIVEEDTTADQDEEDDEALAGTEGEAKTDWALVSRNPFDTAETLTITLTDGSKIEIPTTDERVAGAAASGGRLTVDGVTYTLVSGTGDGTSTTSNEDRNGDGVADGDTYYGRATVYALSSGCKIHNEITDSIGHIYKVWNLRMTGAALQGTTNKMDRELVNRAAGYKFSLPRVRTSIADIRSDPNVTQAELDSLPTSDFKPGDQNTTSGNQVWKKATYNPAKNSIDYEIKTFQAMKQDVPLDFIFIYDDSITMYTGDRGAPRNNGNDNRNETVIREAQATRIMILSAAQALTSRTDGYNIRVAMGGASNNDNRRSDWYDVDADASAAYAGIEDYLATYKTGATSHVIGLNNALTLARQSVSASRQPIVIYLSDFKDGAINNSTATQLKNIARVYTLQTADRTSPYPRASTITSDTSSTFFNMSQIDDGVQKLEKVILDAIGYYMKDKVTITDNLSDALSSMTPQDDATSYVTQDGTAKTGAGTTTDATGKNTWEVGGTSPYLGAGTVYTETFSVKLDDNKVYTGDIPTNGKATVYVDGKEVNWIKPNVNDPDELHVAKDVTFLLGKLDDHDEYTNQVDSYGAPLSGNLIDGIKFTLQEANKSGNNYTAKSGATSYEYTTGSNSDGAITVPYKSGSNVVLQRGHYYLLTEDSGTVDTYNSAAGGDPLLKAPDKSWVITVADNGEISVAPQSGAGQTPEATVASHVPADDTATPTVEGKPARIVLWNMIQVPATLIPIQVQKVWPDNDHPHDPVPFNIFGVDRTTGSRVEKLAAYDGDDTATAKQVRYIAEGSKGFSKSADGLTWTQTVYVLDKDTINGTEYKFFDRRLLTDDGSQYDVGGQKKTFSQLMATYGDEYGVDTDDDGTKDALRYGQTYSYDILEGELKYDFGWYTPEYQNTATKNHENGGSYENEAPSAVNLAGQTFDPGTLPSSAWENVPNENTLTTFGFLLDCRQFVYDANAANAAEFMDYFGLSSNSFPESPSAVRSAFFKEFFESITSLDIVVADKVNKSDYDGNGTKESSTYYRFTINPGTGGYTTDGFDDGNAMYTGLRLPRTWDTHSVADKTYGRIHESNLYIQEVYVTFNRNNITKSFAIYSDGPGGDITQSGAINNTSPWGPKGTGHYREHWMTSVYNRRISTRTTNFSVNSASSSNLQVYTYDPGTPSGYTPSGVSYELKGLPTLTIANAWNDNPLAEINVKKKWKVDEDADSSTTATDYANDTYNAKQDVTFSLKGTNESGVTKSVSIFTPASNSDTDVAAMKSAWNTAGTGGASTGTIAKTDANKDQATWEQPFYVPTYDMSTYKRTVNDDGTETVTGPEKFTYTKTDPTDAEKAYIEANLTENDLTVEKDDDEQNKGTWNNPAIVYEAGTSGSSSSSGGSGSSQSEEWNIYRLTLQSNGYKNVDKQRYWADSYYEGIENIYVEISYTDGQGNSGTQWLGFGFSSPQDMIPADNRQKGFNIRGIRIPKGWTVKKTVSRLAVNGTIVDNSNYTDKSFADFNRNPSARAPYRFAQVKFLSDRDWPDNTEFTVAYSTMADSASSSTPATFTLTNTYTPYKEVKLSSSFNDASEDQSSTEQVKKVIYTIKDSNGDVVRTTDMAMEDGSGESGTTVRQSYFQPDGGTKRNYKSIYLPKGSYTISQSYTLDNGDSAKQYALDDSLDAYSVKYQVNDGTATDGTAYTASIDANRTLAFTNTRKTMPIRVTMDWEPGLTENEDPLKSTSKTIPYKISYDTADTSADTTDKVKGDYTKKYKTSNSGAETSNNLTNAEFNLEYARQTNDHAAGIPTYSVREMLTQCDFSYTEGEGTDAVEKNYLEEILPDYDCNVKQEEIDSNNDGKKDTMVFTIEAHIKRAAVIIEKNFDEKFKYDDYKGSELTFTLKRSDDNNIYGTTTDSVKFSMTIPTQFDLDNNGTIDKDFTSTKLEDADTDTQDAVNNILSSMLTGAFVLHDENTTDYDSKLDAKTVAAYTDNGVLDTINLPILRATDVDGEGNRVKYVVSEAVVKDGTPQSYFPSFTDQTNNSANAFEQTNPAGKNEDTTQFGKANTAKFILNPAGIIIGIGNAETPYICKIVETFGTGENKSEVENPFRTLNAALDFARSNGNGTAMGSNNAVAIEMLVDYTIPSTDKVTLDQSTDNIIITTAQASGGVYNFTDTLAGKAAADKGIAILARGFSSADLFTVSASGAQLATANIIFDGDRDGTITGSAKTGRAINVSNAGAGLTIKGGSTFRNFNSTGAGNSGTGGAIYAKSRVILQNETTTDDILFDNIHTTGTNNAGGALYTGKDVVIRGGEDTEGNELGNQGTVTFNKCTSDNDGGAVVYGTTLKALNNEGTILFKECSTTGSGDEGGAIYTNSSSATELKITNKESGKVTFDSCESSGSGGAICNWTTASKLSITLKGTANGSIKFLNCSSTSSDGGGAIRQNGGPSMDLAYCIFEGCQAKGGAGGAVYSSNTLTASDSMFTDCRANTNGGAVYIYGPDKTGRHDISSCNFDGHKDLDANTVNAANGGAIYVYNGWLTISDSNFYDLTCTTNGGAVFMDGGSNDALNIDGCTFDGHDTLASTVKNASTGGAVYMNADNGIALKNLTVSDCWTSGNGGGVYAHKAITSTDGTISITDCYTTGGNGGGAYFNAATAFGKIGTTGNKVIFTRCHDDSTSTSYGGGGAYFASTLTMQEDTNLSFDSCHAESYGGGAWFNVATTLNSGTVSFKDCHAGKRGGGAYFVKAVTLGNDVTFEKCYTTGTSDGGGGAYFAEALTLDDGKTLFFKECYTAANGGGVYFAAAENNTHIKGTLSFDKCYSTDGKGGGAYFANTSDLSGATAVTFKECHANSTSTSNGGGGAYFYKATTLDEATSFEDCYTGGYGGAMYFAEGGTLTGVNVDGHKTLDAGTNNAAKGGAIYIPNSKILTVIGGEIKNCSASDDAGGAVNGGGTSAVLNFQGAVKIYDNKSTKDGNEVLANVVLDINDNDLIKTTATGLNADAHIGVYVVDSQMSAHGEINDPFGTWTATNGKNNLDRFTNDRNDKLFGMKHEDSDTKIYWGAIICKIEDNNAAGGDKLDGRDVYEHPFPSINAAVDYARANLSGVATIEMLIDYEFPAFDVVNLTGNTDDITITTAATTGCVYNFEPTTEENKGRILSGDDADDADRAILLRSWNGGTTVTASLFYVNNASAKLKTKDIIFDGSQNNTTKYNGRAVYKNAGLLIINGGSTFRNFYTDAAGGAVYSAGDMSIANDVTGKTIAFDNNKARSGACVYSSANITLANKFASDAIQFLNSYATSGNDLCGGATASASLTINGGTKDSGAEQGNQGKIQVEKCRADDDGGAIAFQSSFKALDNEGTILFKDCQTTGSGDEGGAIYTNASSATELRMTNKESGSVTFDTCTAPSASGGAIGNWTTASGLVITLIGTADGPITFLNCSAQMGGAIYQNGGPTGAGTTSMTLDYVQFDNCTATSTIAGAVRPIGSAEISNCTFTDCSAKTNGGALYMEKGGTLENVCVNGHKNLAAGTENAQLGGAVYGNGNLTIKQSGSGKSEIKNCSASTVDKGGAVNVAANKTMTFEGDVVIFNNLSTKSGSQVQANVVLDQNNNTTINTSAAGLGADAHIGVYVTGNMPPQTETNPYLTYGGFEDNFGTYPNETGTSTENFDAFTNDRNGLYGEISPTPNKIRWVSYLCKITDADGNLLYKDDAHTDAAVYKFLKTQTGDTTGKKTGGFNAAQGKLYKADGTAVAANAPVQVQMLRNYTQPGTDQPTINGDRAVTFTTANKTTSQNPGYSTGDIYIYNQGSDKANTEADRATIWRASGATTGSMLTMNGASTSLTTTKLIIDGNMVTTTVDGGIVKVNNGTLNVNAGTIMRKSIAANGGAVYLDNKAVMNLTGGTISGNTVASGKNGAGIYLVEGSKLNISGSPSFEGTSATDGNHIGTGTNAKREDIYIAGYLGTESDGTTPKTAESLIVTGALNVEKGSIWVGAQKENNQDNNHWDTLKQFAKLADSLVTKDSSGKVTEVSGLTEQQLNKVFEAFQNAELPEYFGTAGDDLQCIYWDGVKGSRKVILRKVSTTYESLSGAKFTITKGSKQISGTDIHGNADVTEFESGASGVFYIGVLDYGVYVLNETEHPNGYSGPNFFYLVVDEDGTEMSKPEQGYSSAANAKSAGDAVFMARKDARN